VTSKAGYWIGGGLIAFGIVAALAWGVILYWHTAGAIGDFERVAVPGQGIVLLEPRTYVIYVEGPRADERPPRVRVRIYDPQSDKAVPHEPFAGSLGYPDPPGSAARTVKIPRLGRYLVGVSLVRPKPGYAIAFGGNVRGKIHTTVGGALLIGTVIPLSGIVLLIVTAVRRRRRRV
jgi:hypothetical protein